MNQHRTFALCFFIAIAALACFFGCGGGIAMNEARRVRAVTDRAAFDLSCKGVNVVKLSETSYGAIGCGKKASYVLIDCLDDYWERNCTVTMDAAERTDGAVQSTGNAKSPTK